MVLLLGWEAASSLLEIGTSSFLLLAQKDAEDQENGHAWPPPRKMVSFSLLEKKIAWPLLEKDLAWHARRPRWTVEKNSWNWRSEKSGRLLGVEVSAW